MSKPKKPKKDPAVTAEDRINKAIGKAIEGAIHQINRKLIGQILVERVRQAINVQFHGKLSPAEIDRISKDAARSAAYELVDLSVVPESFIEGLVVTGETAKVPYTEEPNDFDD